MKYTLKKLTALFFIVLISLASLTTYVAATPQDDLDEINRRLEEIRRQKDNVNKSISEEDGLQNEFARELAKIKNQIDLLNIEIEETKLTIKQLRLEIVILQEEIDANEKEAEKAESEIEILQEETDERLVQMYIDQKTFSQINMVLKTDVTSLIKLELYQSTIQKETNKLLEDLKTKKEILEKKLKKLEKDKIEVQRDKTQLVEERKMLERSIVSLDSQKAIYSRKLSESINRELNQRDVLDNLTKDEQWYLAEQNRLQQIIFDNVKNINNGSFVTAGTVIGRQGCSGLCTGPHLHFAVKINNSYVNPCSVLPAGGPCSSSSPQLSHWPIGGSLTITSGYGPRWGGYHYAIDVQNYTDQDTYIFAAHNGYIYYGNDGYCSIYQGSLPCNGAGANYAIICENTNCSVGKKTMYLHLR